MKVTFLGQGLEPESKNAIGYYLHEYVNSSRFYSFTAISAFVSQFAIKFFSEDLKRVNKSFTNLTLIVGIDQEGTSQEALEEILNLNIKSYIFYQKEAAIFHPKMYLFEGENEVKLIIGSSNFTGTGLFKNAESSVLIEFATGDTDGEEFLADLKSYYKSLLDFTDPNLFSITDAKIKEFALAGIVPNEEASRKRYSKNPNNLGLSQTTINIPERQTAKIPTSFFFEKKITDANLEQQLEKALPFVKDLFFDIREKVRFLNENIEIKATNNYVAFKLSNNFIEMHIQKNNLKLHLRPIEYDDPKDRIDKLPGTYKWTLDKRIYINNVEDIEYAMPLIEQSYKDVFKF